MPINSSRIARNSRRNVGIDVVEGIIALWNEDPSNIPEGWVICDGSAGSPNLMGEYVRGTSTESEIGTTAGSDTVGVASQHTHTDNEPNWDDTDWGCGTVNEDSSGYTSIECGTETFAEPGESNISSALSPAATETVFIMSTGSVSSIASGITSFSSIKSTETSSNVSNVESKFSIGDTVKGVDNTTSTPGSIIGTDYIDGDHYHSGSFNNRTVGSASSSTTYDVVQPEFEPYYNDLQRKHQWKATELRVTEINSEMTEWPVGSVFGYSNDYSLIPNKMELVGNNNSNIILDERFPEIGNSDDTVGSTRGNDTISTWDEHHHLYSVDSHDEGNDMDVRTTDNSLMRWTSDTNIDWNNKIPSHTKISFVEVV